jgi:hypothetical protein
MHGLIFAIVKQDIMWIVCYNWEIFFARIEPNLHAITERVLGLVNFVLLDHPELKVISDRVNMVNLRDDDDMDFPQESFYNLSTIEGVAGGTVDLFMEEKAKRDEL